MIPEELSPGELQERLDAGEDLVLLDVREEPELDRGLLPGAMCIPMSQIPQRWPELPEGRPIVVYCEHGVRSAHVAAFLTGQGRTAISMADGFASWTGPVQARRP